MYILVAGGAGFIGSNFVHYLLKNTEHSVITLDALTYAGSKENLANVLDHASHEFIQGDILDQELVTDVITRADAVVNFAAQTHVDRSIEKSTPFVNTNIKGTQVLLNAAANVGVDRFLQISTDEVYGQIKQGRFTEDDCLSPRNPYAATKAGADLLAQSYYTTHDIPIVITRTCNNYGPRQHIEKLIPKFITRAAEGKHLPLYGNGLNIREWIYVKDNCRAIYAVLEHGTVGEVYNIGTDDRFTNLEVTRRILDEMESSKNLITFIEDRAGHDQRYALETSKIESLGWKPQWTFDDGLQDTIEYYI
ncbi:dTDP-glucose 4,6-dehydratase [Halocatena halophila]|uniref:dTDP-glucose 4,6-dehydratase n=1 Tax=Halocatena halophila TaxID=2814576 RepID=UPI002ED38FE1